MNQKPDDTINIPSPIILLICGLKIANKVYQIIKLLLQNTSTYLTTPRPQPTVRPPFRNGTILISVNTKKTIKSKIQSHVPYRNIRPKASTSTITNFFPNARIRYDNFIMHHVYRTHNPRPNSKNMNLSILKRIT